MRKFTGGVVRFLVVVALVAATVWNALRVQELEARLARLEGGRGLSSRPSLPDGPGPLEALRESKRHADRAQRLLREGRLEPARRELSRAGERLREAGRKGLGETPDLGSLETARRRLESLTREAESLAREAEAIARRAEALVRPETAPDGKEARK